MCARLEGLCMCMCVDVHECACLFVCTCMRTYVFTPVCMLVQVCMHAYVCLSVCIRVHTHVSTYLYVQMYASMCVCILPYHSPSKIGHFQTLLKVLNPFFRTLIVLDE